MTVALTGGRFLPLTEAALGCLDRGFLYGDGAFETMRAYDGRIFRLAQHLTRLEKALVFLEIRLEQPLGRLGELLEELVARNGLRDAYVRLTVTRGIHTGELTLRQEGPPTVFAFAGEARTPNNRVSLCPVDGRISSSDPLRRFKTTNYLFNLLARSRAHKQGASDAVLLNEKGDVCETTTSNLFLLCRGVVRTPTLEVNILDGIARSTVIEICRDAGLECHQEAFGLEALESADEMFVTNSIGEVMPVERWKVKELPAPGAITQRLARAYAACVARETMS